MSLWRDLTRGLRALINRTRTDDDIADEVEHYLEQAASTFEQSGLSPEEARRAARLELGNVTAVREQMREYGWENVIDTAAADVRYGVRRLCSSPGFTVAAALTLALGIGASTAIFSAVKPILLEPLPYPDAGRLTMIWDGQHSSNEVTFGTYRELVERSRSFESIAVMKPLQVTLTGAGEPERLNGQYVSADYFRVLGVRPALGRDFQQSDDGPWRPQGPIVAIISDGVWHRRFSGDPAIVGRQTTIQDLPVTIIGVLPAGFENVLSPTAEIWSTLQYDTSLPLNGREWGNHLRMVGRLRPEVQLDQAKQELTSIAQTKISEFPRPPQASLGDGFLVNALQADLTRSVRPALLAIIGAVILLLLIACVNVTNLLLARGVARRDELAVRAALGASRMRLIHQSLIETLLLSTVGGVLGIIMAYAAVEAVVLLSPPELPRAFAIKLDGAALVFTLGLTTLIGVTIGAVPALNWSKGDVHSGIQRGSSRITGGHQFVRRTLVVVQVALALILLIHAGLLLRSLQSLFAVPLGFEASNLLTMQVQTAGQRFRDANTTHQFFAEALEGVRQLPGVSAAAFTSQLPLSGDADTWGVHLETSPAQAAGEDPSAYRYAVSPGYFEVMGIPLRQGRVLNSLDVAGVPPVAVISESFAKRRLPGLNPIGQRLSIGPINGYTVVGVVADVKQTSLDLSPTNAVYITAAQWPQFADNARWLVVRAQNDVSALTPVIRRAIWSVDKNQPIVRVASMNERVAVSEARRRFALMLFEAFGAMAMVLAAIGTYSLLSNGVTERTREIAVRLAVGASRRSIVTLVLRQGLALAGLGVVFGAIGAMIASRALVTLLFGISRLDSTTYVGVIALLVGVSTIASAVPAWTAARVSPSIALKSE